MIPYYKKNIYQSFHVLPSSLFPPFQIPKKFVYTLRLSLLKINNANRCLTNNPINPHIPCMTKISTANRSSLFGPNHTNHKFNNVKLLLSIISPSLLNVRPIRWNL